MGWKKRIKEIRKNLLFLCFIWLLRELIEKIDVHKIEGTGKNRTQRVITHYRFVGCLQIPEWHRKRKVTLESKQGVAVNYLPTTA